jgi:hypothetical protein
MQSSSHPETKFLRRTLNTGFSNLNKKGPLNGGPFFIPALGCDQATPLGSG